MLTTAQHKATSAITSAEGQKSVQNWRSSPTSNTLLLNTGHTSCSSWGKVVGQRGFATVASQGKIQQRILHQRSGAYMTSASSLQVEAAWVRGLSLETMPFWPGTSSETNSSPRRATFRLKTQGALCKHWRLHPSLANHLAWSKCMAKSSFPFKTSGMSWGLASAKLHVSQISAVDRKLFIQTFW